MSQFTLERIEFFSDLLYSKNIKIIKELDVNIFIEFSTLELSRIIDNTLSNAIKYSKNATTITINITKHNNTIILKIEDEGKGIKDIDKIFQRYYRGDKITGGFGIGLSIVKNICDKNNVQIKVASREKKGSTFTFVFNVKNS